MAVLSHKKEPTANSDMVCVGKKAAKDKVFVAYYEEGPNENEEIQTNLDGVAKAFEKYSKLFKSGMPKPKARAGKIANLDDDQHANELLINSDIVTIITEIYPNLPKIKFW